METDIKTWILVGVAGVLVTVLGFIIKVVTAQVLRRLDEIVTELKQLSHTTTIQNEQIKTLQVQDTIHTRRIRKINSRLTALELRAASA